MQKAGGYLKDLRRARKLSQSALAEAVDTGRGTIQRLEKGDGTVNVGTVLHVLDTLGASPWFYNDLALQPGRTLGEVRQQRAIVRGVAAYVRVLATYKHVSRSAIDEVTQAALGLGTNDGMTPDAISPYALLRALVVLDAPLADLAAIIRAPHDHETIGRQLAETRGALAVAVEQARQSSEGETQPIPSLDAVVARVAAMVRANADLPAMVKHELARVEADLRRYRALLARAVGDITAQP